MDISRDCSGVRYGIIFGFLGENFSSSFFSRRGGLCKVGRNHVNYWVHPVKRSGERD